MEHERLVSEKQSIRDSARQLKKYGSTCNHVRNSEQLIRHDLEKTDTLQGIALKYGCTVRIRRSQLFHCQYEALLLYIFDFTAIRATLLRPDIHIFFYLYQQFVSNVICAIDWPFYLFSNR